MFLSFNSKIQKYSPTESAKVYDKTVNRKSNIHFNPRQTMDFISNNMAHATLTDDVKRRIVKQYLDVSNKASSEHLQLVGSQFFSTFSVGFTFLSPRCHLTAVVSLMHTV